MEIQHYNKLQQCQLNSHYSRKQFSWLSTKCFLHIYRLQQLVSQLSQQHVDYNGSNVFS